ncbi:MAG TPA: type III-A CRISPR-associated protein Cas10/Csm1, partial [Deltaproteobacteria bacterium]|nr:type III-A CRISPR-associated protein Cas10/Csm1 [Deltaproteobacteria bacterium]
MDDTILKITLAAFLHDIGKFAEEGMEMLPGFWEGNAALYQPEHNGQFSHRHALYTAAFIDHIEKLLPTVFNKAQWGLEDPFINLAAGHHKPETPLQWVIAMADRIASGWDRTKFDTYNTAVAWQDYRKTRLMPLFEHLGKDRQPAGRDGHAWRYPLREISAQGIFPVQGSQAEPKEDIAARAEYKKLFEAFVSALEKLRHREEDVALWLEHLDSLMLIFTSSIPAARAGNTIPDVSLYDHARITAALAAALYLYHTQTESLNVPTIQDDMPAKFLLIGGDFYGIQDFIFSDGGQTGKARSKILRGRSFAVTLFSELAADMLCRAIGLTALSVVLNAAGKFTIIAPNTPETLDAIRQVEQEINAWLMRHTFGESALGIAWEVATPADFKAGVFADLWERLGRSMERRKFHKLDLDRCGGAVPGYLDAFHNDLKHPLCPFCGKRPSSPQVEGARLLGEAHSACVLCHDHILLGERIVKDEQIAVLSIDAVLKGEGNHLLEPVFGRYRMAFLGGALTALARQGQVLKFWDTAISRKDGTVQKEITARFINGYVPLIRTEDLYDERIIKEEKSEARQLEDIDQLIENNLKTFGHIAAKARNPVDDGKYEGIAALGVLKADVDQLGMLMSAGIPPELFTVSRLAALSRQLNFFFTVYLPH